MYDWKNTQDLQCGACCLCLIGLEPRKRGSIKSVVEGKWLAIRIHDESGFKFHSFGVRPGV